MNVPGGNINSSQLEMLKSMSKPGENLLDILVNVFLTTTPPIIESLKSAWINNDIEATAKHAHKLKSSAANLGLSGLSHLCQTIEQGLKAGAVLDYDHLISKIDAYYLEGKLFLETFKSEVKS